MTDDLRTAGEQVAKWVAKRNGLIRQAHAEGMSHRAIASAVGLSHAGVARIVRAGVEEL